MINAKAELLSVINPVDIKAAAIQVSLNYDADPIIIELREGYTATNMEQFLQALDFEYDNGYGIQVIYGTIWTNYPNKWLFRFGYDGSEMWKVGEMPPIPGYLTRI